MKAPSMASTVDRSAARTRELLDLIAPEVLDAIAQGAALHDVAAALCGIVRGALRSIPDPELRAAIRDRLVEFLREGTLQ